MSYEYVLIDLIVVRLTTYVHSLITLIFLRFLYYDCLIMIVDYKGLTLKKFPQFFF